MSLVVLGCAATALAGEKPPDAELQLQEAQTAYTEAKTLYDAGQYAEAVVQGEHARVRVEAVLGGMHPGVATCLKLLGNIYLLQGDFDRAEPLLQRALTIREAALGESHPEVAQALHDLALLYRQQGLYGRAEPLDERALAIREAALGSNHLIVADSLHALANLYQAQGRMVGPEPLHQRALAIREAAVGKNHPDVTSSLHDLAHLYQAQGAYGRAEPLHQRALAIQEASVGKNHPDVASSLHNLTSLYQVWRSHSWVEPLDKRALVIREAAFVKSQPEVASSLHALANVYQAQGAYGRAEPLHKRALAIREAAFGKNHPDVASSLHNLALLYHAQALYGRAEPLDERALAIRGAAFGSKHPEVASSLHNLANLYQAQGENGRAEPLHQRALAIREATLGKNHPDIASSLNSLALLRLAQHRPDAAVPLFSRAFAVSEQRLRHEALDFSEARLASFLQLLRSDEERLYALLREHPDLVSVRRLALSAALLLKGRSVEETASISQAIYRSMGADGRVTFTSNSGTVYRGLLGADERETFERLRDLRTQQAHLSLQGPGPLPPPAYQQQLQELASQGDALEAALARRSAPLRAMLTVPPAPADIVDRVAQALPGNGALIELIAYEHRPLLPESGLPEPQLRYLALVLLPDTRILTLDLGPAAPIDSAALRLRDALANRDASFQAHAQALYRLAFQPLLPLLGKARRLFLSPDGQLALVPFAALHDGHHFLVDTFDFTYLTSGKDLLPRPQQPVPASTVVVLADPDFSAPLPPPDPSLTAARVSAERSTSLERFSSTRREELARRDWNLVPLPGSRREAQTIRRLLPHAQLFLGPEATKERLWQLPAPGILHLATHGFFLGDAPAPMQSRAVGSVVALGRGPARGTGAGPAAARRAFVFAG
ncbi:tetratricopeptide repeat protein, partial [Pyxidicoccus sp. 3LFB2]